MPWLLAGAPSDGFLLNVLKQLLGYLVYLEISKRRYKSCICSVILGQLESFRNYKGLSIFVPKIPMKFKVLRKWEFFWFLSRQQLTFSDATTGIPARWRLRNERRNSILMVCHYPDLDSASDCWKFHPISSTASGLWHIISMGFLLSFLRRNFAGKQVLASPNIGYFLML